MGSGRVGSFGRVGLLLGAWLAAGAVQSASLSPGAKHAPLLPSAAVRKVLAWARSDPEVSGKPFAIVDKRAARIFVYGSDGLFAGAAPALLGLARGDESAPGVGQRAGRAIPAHQRTTPAGRFRSEPGRNDQGEAIVWVDYDAAVAIHRLRPGEPAQRRAQRLASASADDKRISLGCIVVSVEFYRRVVAPLLGRMRGVVYVLPETAAGAAKFEASRTADF